MILDFIDIVYLVFIYVNHVNQATIDQVDKKIDYVLIIPCIDYSDL